jgi:hypothetical protein
MEQLNIYNRGVEDGRKEAYKEVKMKWEEIKNIRNLFRRIRQFEQWLIIKGMNGNGRR